MAIDGINGVAILKGLSHKKMYPMHGHFARAKNG